MRKYILSQQLENGRLAYVRVDETKIIQWTSNKELASKFQRFEYPHYKNDFMQVEEVEVEDVEEISGEDELANIFASMIYKKIFGL